MVSKLINFLIGICIGLPIAIYAVQDPVQAEIKTIIIDAHVVDHKVSEIQKAQFPKKELVKSINEEATVFISDSNIPLPGELQNEINEICEQYGICYELVIAMMEKESTFRSDAVNGDCIGLMQINGKVHKDRMERLGVTDLYDPVQNVLVGVDYLAELSAQESDIYLVLMKYNTNHKNAMEQYESGDYSDYAVEITERSAELERKHGK